ncbi:MAG: 3-isopropylmalate dehydratase small subunit [Alphaproteobacteria bacterium]
MRRSNVGAHIFGDQINTDVIVAGRHLGSTDPSYLAKYCFETIRPNFADSVTEGDVVVAGENFGCGSSREHAAIAIKATGISCVLCRSAAMIFFRSAINIALPVLICPEAVAATKSGSRLDFDCISGQVAVDGRVFDAEPLSANLLDILDHGGLLAKLRARLNSTVGNQTGVMA